MREMIASIDTWLEQGRSIAIATVIKTWGSSPRPAGSHMAITGDGRIVGSVSGGCVESDVVSTALDVLVEGTMVIRKYHATQKAAHDVGLSCGGDIDVCIRPLDREAYAAQRKFVMSDEEHVHALVIESQNDDLSGRELCWGHGTDDANRGKDIFAEIKNAVISSLTDSTARTIECSFGKVFAQKIFPQPQLISIGATHVAIHLMKIAKLMGYRTIVIDPRAVFATEERFSFVDELIHAWPQKVFETRTISSGTAICALTHDPKIDEPALAIASASDAFYIGSLGRSTTQVQRYEGLVEAGVAEKDIERIYGPIGLDIGGKEPEAIALSIMSEIHAVRNGATLSTKTMMDTVRRERDIEQKVLA